MVNDDTCVRVTSTMKHNVKKIMFFFCLEPINSLQYNVYLHIVMTLDILQYAVLDIYLFFIHYLKLSIKKRDVKKF